MTHDREDARHPATPARRIAARQSGDIPHSQQLALSIQMLLCLLTAWVTLSSIGSWLKSLAIDSLSQTNPGLSTSKTEFTTQFQQITYAFLIQLGPALLLFFLITIGSYWIQTGPIFRFNRLAPEMGRVSFTRWFRDLFSFTTWANLFVGLPRIAIVAAVMFFSIYNNRTRFVELSNHSADVMLNQLFLVCLTSLIHVAIALLICSLADYAICYVSYLRRIRMTDQELRDELRNQNGDPQIRNRQRQLQRVHR